MPVIKVKSEEVKIKVPVTVLRIEPTTQAKTVEPTIEEQVITPDEGVFALSSVTVNPVTSEIDENIKAENIKEGVSILGVEGNVVIPDTNIEITDTSYLFYKGVRIDNLKSLLDLCKNVTNSSYMFYNSDESELDLSNFDTSEIIDMSYMFYGNRYLQKVIGLENFNTSKVENMSNLFSGTMFSTTWDLSNFDTSATTKMDSMFYNNQELIKVIASEKFNTSKVTTMASLYRYCYKLTEVPDMDTSSLVMMDYAFQNCKLIETLPLFEAGTIQYITSTFTGCNALTNFNGLKEIGKAYNPTQSANHSYYRLVLSDSKKLTEQSLTNILNNLYDIASMGVKTQTCQLGSTNLAKLTSEEGQQALANAQAKGWTVS